MSATVADVHQSLLTISKILTGSHEMFALSQMIVAKSVSPCLSDWAGHFEIPLRLVGDPVPAAQTGGGWTVSTAACRPFLPRLCRFHLPMVSLFARNDSRCVHLVVKRMAAKGPAGVSVCSVFTLISATCVLIFECISCFDSLRKKPNERPAYTELMVSRFYILFLSSKHKHVSLCYLVTSNIHTAMFSVLWLWLLSTRGQAYPINPPWSGFVWFKSKQQKVKSKVKKNTTGVLKIRLYRSWSDF